MSEDFQLTPLPADAELGELLEALGSGGRASAGIAVLAFFAAAANVFVLPVLDVEEVLEWPLVTKTAAGPGVHAGNFQFARRHCAAD